MKRSKPVKKSYLALGLGVSLACVAAVAAVQAQKPAPPEAPGLMGVIKDAAGKPMGGVTVSAKADGSTMTTSVYTDDKGAYVFPHLAAGAYSLWAQAVGFTKADAVAKLDGVHTVRRPLSLKPAAEFGAQLTGYEWFSSLPDDTVDHKRMKQVLYVGCSGCHGLEVALQDKFDEQGWTNIIKGMETTTYNGWRGQEDSPAAGLGWEAQILRYHREELAKYLAEVRGPNSPDLKLNLFPRPTGDAANAVVTEYQLPSAERDNDPTWYDGSDWSQGPATGMHGIVGVHDVFADADGNAWEIQSRTTFETNRTLVKIDHKTGAMKVFKVDGADGKTIFFEQGGVDPSGNMWMHNGNSIVKLDPKTEALTQYPLPRVMGGMENSTDTDFKGHVFANGRFGVVELDPEKINDKGVAYPGWHLWQQTYPGNGTTYGISTDADDNVWWSESYADKVASKNLKTGKVTEFDMHDPDYDARKALMRPSDLAFYDSIGGGLWSGNSASPLPYANMPRRLSADKRGDTVWVPNWAQDNVAEINIHSGKVTYHKLPVQVHPYKTTVDPQHNVWVDTQIDDAIWRFTPSTQVWTRFPMPSHGCSSRHISFDDVKGDPWLPCDQSNKVARYHLRSATEIKQLAAAAK